MVLDDGRIVSYIQTEIHFPHRTTFKAEFDSPKTLLQKRDGFLKSLVDDSGDKDALCAMADSRVARE